MGGSSALLKPSAGAALVYQPQPQRPGRQPAQQRVPPRHDRLWQHPRDPPGDLPRQGQPLPRRLGRHHGAHPGRRPAARRERAVVLEDGQRRRGGHRVARAGRQLACLAHGHSLARGEAPALLHQRHQLRQRRRGPRGTGPCLRRGPFPGRRRGRPLQDLDLVRVPGRQPQLRGHAGYHAVVPLRRAAQARALPLELGTPRPAVPREQLPDHPRPRLGPELEPRRGLHRPRPPAGRRRGMDGRLRLSSGYRQLGFMDLQRGPEHVPLPPARATRRPPAVGHRLRLWPRRRHQRRIHGRPRPHRQRPPLRPRPVPPHVVARPAPRRQRPVARHPLRPRRRGLPPPAPAEQHRRPRVPLHRHELHERPTHLHPRPAQHRSQHPLRHHLQRRQ